MRRLLAAAGVAAESRWAIVDGRRLHYLEAGRGPVVVLIHGAGGGAANWFGVLGRLAERYRVLAPDLPGFGLSDAMVPRAPLGRVVADVLAGWLDGLGVHRYGVAGTSFGGLVALRLAEARPRAASRLALLDSAGLGPELPALIRLTGVRMLGGLLLRPSRRGSAWALRHLLTSGRPLDPAVEPVLLSYLVQSARAGDLPILGRAFRSFGGLRGQREVLDDRELAGIAQPTLVVWGRLDRFFPPAHAERAAARIPDAALYWVDGAGHSPNWEAPGEVADVLVGFFAPAAGAP